MRVNRLLAAAVSLLGSLLLVAATAGPSSAAVSSTPVVGWVPQAGGVHALATDGTWIYLGGDFTSVKNPVTKKTQTSMHLIRLSLATGNPDPTWTPSVDGDIRTMVFDPAASVLYLGGSFATVDGAARSDLAAVNTPDSGTVTGWNPGADAPVLAMIQLDPSTMLVGGQFLHIGSVTRNHLAKVSTGGVLDATFAPKINKTVRSLALPAGASFVLMGGDFTLVGGTTRMYIAEVDLTTALPTAWNMGDPCGSSPRICPALALITTPTAFYIAAGGPGGRVQNVDPISGHIRWSVGSDGDDQALALIGNELYVGGHYDPHFGNVTRYTLAGVDATTGAIDPAFAPFAINPFPGIAAMLVTPNGSLAVGGNTGQIGGTTDAKYALFAPTT